MSLPASVPSQPLSHLEDWDEFLEGRYQEGKSETEFRQYDAEANPGCGGVLPHQPPDADRRLRPWQGGRSTSA